MEPDSKRVIAVLQAGRALAAIAVVTQHAAVAARDFAGPFPGLEILNCGYLGVDFFFVLSGFIIYHSTVAKSRTVAEYALARVGRVFIPYLPVGVGIALFYTALPNVSQGGDRMWTWLPTLTLVPFSATALSVAWTLQHEMLFYTLFALFYFSGILWIGLFAWAIAIVLLPSSAIPFAPINLEFLMGIVAALLYRRGVGHWLFLVAAALLVGLWIALGAHREQSPIFGLACACAILELSLREQRGTLKVPRSLVFLGAASYALYLVHGLAISLVARAAGNSWHVILIASLPAALLAGISYYWWVERRLIGWWQRAVRMLTRASNRRPTVPSAAP